MKIYFSEIGIQRYLTIAAITVVLLITSCIQKDVFEQSVPIADASEPVVQSSNEEEMKAMFCYNKTDVYENYCMRQLTTSVGAAIECSGESEILNGWNHLTGVSVGNRQFLFFHNSSGGNSKNWMIMEVLATGHLGSVTDGGKDDNLSWSKNYETIVGFHIGEKGYIFGQDSYGDHYWFVQEITGQGKLGIETDNGEWHNYYESVTPIYVGGNTYLFFQTSDNDNYWFISRVSPDGKLSDVCDGYWGNLWNPVTSVTINGNTYLIGEREQPLNYYNAEWFVQRINPDGTMGEETDRGVWKNYYHILNNFTYKGSACIFGHSNTYNVGGAWFIQTITPDGKMGTELSHGWLDKTDTFFYPFNMNDPSNFRYEIGWDLAKTTGSPARGWSSLFQEPWTAGTKFGGGAALADIDHDANQRYDALMVGIQDMSGADRFYYQVAWNLDNTGKSSSWSKTFYGPYCGESQDGGGADIADIDGNGVPDLLIMSVDDPEKANSFWYYIGWNMGTNGQVSSWSGKIQVDGLGWDNSGGGAALGDIDHNGKQDLVLMGIDDPQGANKFWYRIGRNLDQNGNAASWTGNIAAPFKVGDLSAGGGASLADVNGNGKPDLILTDIDSPQGPNNFWCYIGWDIDINGNVTGWSSLTGPAPGNMTKGGGTAVGDIDKNGIPDLLLMSVDDPNGND